MFLLIGKILSLSFVNITMEIMSLLHYLLNKETMSLETMSPSAMGTRSYEVGNSCPIVNLSMVTPM